MADDGPKIQIDSDWKKQAQAEKQKLAEQAKAKQAGAAGSGDAPATGGKTAGAAGPTSGGGGGGQRGLPPATFETLVSTTATQALFAMGAIPDPRTGQRMQHLDLARHHIDMLGVIEAKTKGNLSEEETAMLSTTLYELRSRYVQLAMAARQV
jgi:hypothetical protein